MSNDEKKFQPIFQILHIKSAWFLLELAMALVTQLIGILFSPSRKLKKWTQPFPLCLELVMGILNASRKFFLVVYEPILKLQGLVAVEFQGKNGFTKMVSNFFEIDFGFT